MANDLAGKADPIKECGINKSSKTTLQGSILRRTHIIPLLSRTTYMLLCSDLSKFRSMNY